MSAIEGQAQLEKLIVANIAKDAFMALEDAYRDGDRKGREYGARFAPGHRRSAGGQDKHFALNESMFVALEAHGANPQHCAVTVSWLGGWVNSTSRG